MSRKHVYFVISTIVTVGVFYYLLKFVSLADLKQLVWEMDKSALLAFVILSFCMSGYRTWRYKLLLSTAGESPPVGTVFLIVLIRNFFSDLLPARIGSAIYIYLIHQRAGVALAPATASFGYAFIFDIVALAPLILVALLFIGSKELPVAVLGIAGVVLGALSLIAIYSLPRILGYVNINARKLAERNGTTWLKKALCFLQDIEKNVNETHRAGIFGRLLALSLMVRVCKYGALYVFLLGLLAPQGIGMSQLPLSSVFLGICAAEFSASLPISGIGGFGLYEGTWTIIFRLLGFPLDLAALTAVSHHLLTQVFGYSLGAGAIMLLLLPIPFRLNVQLPRKTPFALNFFLAVVLTTLLPAFAFQAASAPAKKTFLENAERKAIAIPELEAKISARVVFDSNRSGSFGIYALDLGSGLISTIVDSESHEMYPDPSPSGEQVVFARTRSLQRQAPADVWIVDLKSREATKLVKDGTFPSFSADGRFVFFERDRKRIYSFELATKQEKLIFPTDKKAFGGKQVVKPRISPDGKYAAFTSDKKGKWNAWYADLSTGESEHISHGCEPTWFHDTGDLAFINTSEAKSGSGVFRFDKAREEISALHDMGSPMGHEYFPTLTKDDSYLLFSACPDDQHSHSEANYQLYVRDLSSDTLHQLTKDSFTNRWPKLLKGDLCREKICAHIKS